LKKLIKLVSFIIEQKVIDVINCLLYIILLIVFLFFLLAKSS